MDKKTQIIEAALKLMQIKGLENLKVDEIAEKAGVSKRTLYRYFASKKELVTVIISEKHDFIQKKISEILVEDGNAVDKYDRLLTFVTREISSEKFKLFEYLKKYPDLYEDIQIKQQKLMQNLEKIIEKGIAKKEIEDEFHPRIVAFLLIKMANIIFDPDFFMNNKVTFEEVTDNLKNMVLNGLKAKG